MSPISREMIEKYQEILRKDPHSKVFAALADAYREVGRPLEAESTARAGVERHPDYVGGYVALARLLTSQGRNSEAIPVLTQAVQLSPDNLLAYQLLGQAYLETKQPRQALKAHKMALFLNPLSERSRKAVEKLETLTAEDYEEDLFQMKPLPRALEAIHPDEDSPTPPPVAPARPTHLPPPEEAERKKERQLSLIDALIVRNEITKAQEMIETLFHQHPEDPQVRRRWELLKEEEEPVDLRPLMSRERAVVERQIHRLRQVLRKLEEIRSISVDSRP